MRWHSTALVLLLNLCLAAGPLAGATVTLTPAADATLMGVAPQSSAGGADFFISGTTQNGTSNRALIRFDVAAVVPPRAVILSVAVQLHVIQQPKDGYAASYFGLHRVLQPWGEGTNMPAGGGGHGAPAAAGDATWTHRFFGTPATWTVPGGAAGADYIPAFSSAALIEDTTRSPYLFESTAEAVADVQHWIKHPELNHGWMLISDSEGEIFTARKLASREYAGLEPLLHIDYLVPPLIEGMRAVSNEFQFSFTAEPTQAYMVERTTNLPATAWTSVMNLPAPGVRTNVVVRDSLDSASGIYRVRTH